MVEYDIKPSNNADILYGASVLGQIYGLKALILSLMSQLTENEASWTVSRVLNCIDDTLERNISRLLVNQIGDTLSRDLGSCTCQEALSVLRKEEGELKVSLFAHQVQAETFGAYLYNVLEEDQEPDPEPDQVKASDPDTPL